MSLPISLVDLATYAQAMSADARNTLDERDLWAGIALEIVGYLTTSDDPALFDHTQGDPT